MQPKLSVSNYFPSVLVIDEVDIAVKVRRLTNRQFDEFSERWDFFGNTRPAETQLTAEENAAREEENRQWTVEALNDYFVILPNQIRHEDEQRWVEKGGDLLDLYGGRTDVVPQALALVLGENKVNGKKKEAYRSHLASAFGLRPEPPKTGSGDAPDSTATSAAPSSSVPLEAVTGPSSDGSSGTTAPSLSSRPARSGSSRRKPSRS